MGQDKKVDRRSAILTLKAGHSLSSFIFKMLMILLNKCDIWFSHCFPCSCVFSHLRFPD